ncbi:MAG TPA: hypothetical protein VGI76_00995 [Solirubrobacteraceae bacterium]|jgi:hypothetical protein
MADDDEFRVRAHTPDAPQLYKAIQGIEQGHDAHGQLPRAAVTHDRDDVFLYVGSEQDAERARAIVKDAMDHEDLAGELEVARWHPLEERWEDAAQPLPASEGQRAAEHARLEQEETEESAQAGYAEWEVRVTLPTHHDARAFAERLRSDGIPVNQRWRHLLVGANDEDDAAALAERLRAEAPEGSEIHTEGNGLPYWQMLHPYAFLGGIAN